MSKRRLIEAVFATGLCLLLGGLLTALPTLAARGENNERETAVPLSAPRGDTAPPPGQPGYSSEACLLCHTSTDETITFPSGEEVSVHVDAAALAASAHGQMAESPLACQDCHQPPNDYQYPHPPVAEETLREWEIAKSGTCERCHVQPHLTSHPGPDSENPVVCTDCHGSHEVQPAESWHTEANVENCTACHETRGVEVTADMATAVIEAGLFSAQKQDRAYCLSCHSQPGQTMQFANGDTASITIDGSALHDSVHGASNEWDELQCTDCHQNYEFPHQPVTAVTHRQYSLNQDNLCQRCHEGEFAKALSSVHSAALVEGIPHK